MGYGEKNEKVSGTDWKGSDCFFSASFNGFNNKWHIHRILLFAFWPIKCACRIVYVYRLRTIYACMIDIYINLNCTSDKFGLNSSVCVCVAFEGPLFKQFNAYCFWDLDPKYGT